MTELEKDKLFQHNSFPHTLTQMNENHEMCNYPIASETRDEFLKKVTEMGYNFLGFTRAAVATDYADEAAVLEEIATSALWYFHIPSYVIDMYIEETAKSRWDRFGGIGGE